MRTEVLHQNVDLQEMLCQVDVGIHHTNGAVESSLVRCGSVDKNQSAVSTRKEGGRRTRQRARLIASHGCQVV